MKRPTIYLIDGDHSGLDELYNLLASLNAEIERFTSAESFLQLDRSEELACLVANVALPGLSGLELIEKLRENDVHLPAVLIDNRADVSTAVRAMRAGVFDYIEMHFADRLLLKAVSDAISAYIENDPSGPSVNT